MKKIITAIGNENINNELKKQINLQVLLNDIQYKEGIVEVLEDYEDVDFIIINSELPGEMSLKQLIQNILEINKRIKIIIFSENKNEELEKYLYNKGVYKVLYDNEIEISDLIKLVNNNSENDELKEEINKLKEIILEKEKRKNKNIFKILKNKIKNIILKIKNKLSKNKINNIYNNYENKNNKINKNIIKIKKHKNKKIIINSISKNTSAQTIIILKNNSNKNPEINNIKNEDKIKIIEIN